MTGRELLIAILSGGASLLAAGAAVWRDRRSGPDAINTLMGNQNEFTDRLMSRITQLEGENQRLRDRVSELENRLDTYMKEHE